MGSCGVLAVLAVSAVAVAFVVVGAGPCLVGATGVSLFSRLVQIRTMVATLRASGVSAAAWLLLVGSGAAWAATRVLRDDWVLFASAVGIGAASLAVVGVANVIRRSETADDVALRSTRRSGAQDRQIGPPSGARPRPGRVGDARAGGLH